LIWFSWCCICNIAMTAIQKKTYNWRIFECWYLTRSGSTKAQPDVSPICFWKLLLLLLLFPGACVPPRWSFDFFSLSLHRISQFQQGMYRGQTKMNSKRLITITQGRGGGEGGITLVDKLFCWDRTLSSLEYIVEEQHFSDAILFSTNLVLVLVVVSDLYCSTNLRTLWLPDIPSGKISGK
jgi:hypothetical protein